MEIDKKIVKQTFIWGFVLWFIGYVLGIILFPFVSTANIGWVITPIGIAVTLWVLIKKIERPRFQCYIGLGFVWMIMAIILDYLFIVKALHPVDGYYKLDVYLYYALTLILPILVGWRKIKAVK